MVTPVDPLFQIVVQLTVYPKRAIRETEGFIVFIIEFLHLGGLRPLDEVPQSVDKGRSNFSDDDGRLGLLHPRH